MIPTLSSLPLIFAALNLNLASEETSIFSDAGRTVISGRFIGPVMKTRSEIQFMGNIDLVTIKTIAYTCEFPGRVIDLKIHVAQAIDFDRVCKTASQASEYIASGLNSKIPNYEIHIIDENSRFNLDITRWAWRTPIIVLAAPWFRDEQKRYGNIADLVAHETFHVVGAMKGSPLSQDEYSAYYLGLCGQLQVTHRIGTDTAPGYAISGDFLVKNSSSAAQRVRQEIDGYFEKNEIIDRSEGAKFIYSKCQSTLSRS